MTSEFSRADIVALIRRYEERCPERKHIATDVELFVQRDVACADRANEYGHLTGSAWVVNKARTKALLLRHRKHNRWMQLGGHADGELDLCAVAQREAREESGISNIRVVSREILDIDIHEIPAWKETPAHLHFDLRFLLEAEDTEIPTANEESNGVEWVPLSDLRSYTTEDSVLRLGELCVRFDRRQDEDSRACASHGAPLKA